MQKSEATAKAGSMIKMVRVEASMFWMEKRCAYFLITSALDRQRLTCSGLCCNLRKLKHLRKIHF